jgi:hypothetical protein
MMTFDEAIKHITGEKLHPGRGHKWMKRFITACASDYRKSLEEWFNKKGDLDSFVADFLRSDFARWKREEKSQKAKQSRSKRKRGRVKRDDDGRLGPRLPG